MTKEELIKIIDYIVKQGISTVQTNTDEKDLTLDYVAIFSKSQSEYLSLIEITKTIGSVLESADSGETFILNPPVETSGFKLKLLKIRKPDLTRPYRGAPDFKVSDYPKFEERYLKNSNFSLVVGKDYEMMELKGIDVLVYFPNKTLSQDLGL